jgi:hypothetical protein
MDRLLKDPITVFLMAVTLMLVGAFVAIAQDDSEPTPEDTSGFNCPYIKIAADDGDRDAAEFYANNC